MNLVFTILIFSVFLGGAIYVTIDIMKDRKKIAKNLKFLNNAPEENRKEFKMVHHN